MRCSYCALVRNYKSIPFEYPKLEYYHKNEMTTEYIIEVLGKLKVHNPNCFHILYGGEPTLRSDLPEIINFCNNENIAYTIITNNSPEVQPMIENLIMKTDKIMGLTSSVDPLIIQPLSQDTDRYKKSVAGFKKLIELKDFIDDVVAEITVDRYNVKYLYQLVKLLSDNGINSDITFVDIAKTPYYDFSNVTDKNLLVQRTPELEDQIQRIIDEKLDVHMAKTLLPVLLDNLPANINCEMEKTIHNMTIDAEGSLRMCLRIRGTQTPRIQAIDAFTKDGKLHPFVYEMITKDKKLYCRGCQWSCVLMSKMLNRGNVDIGDLVHDNKRQK